MAKNLSQAAKKYFEARDLGLDHPESLSLAGLPADWKLAPPKFVSGEEILAVFGNGNGGQRWTKKQLSKIAKLFSPFIVQCVGESLDWASAYASRGFCPNEYEAVFKKKIAVFDTQSTPPHAPHGQ